MKDRLKDLKGDRADEADLDDVELQGGGGGSGGGEQGEGFMSDFFEDVGKIKATMSKIRKNMEEVSEKQSKALTAISTEQKEKIGKQLEEIVDATSEMFHDIGAKLKALNDENKKKSKSEGMTSETRIRTNMHGTLTRKYLDLLREFEEMQSKYKNKIRETVARQVKIVNPNASQEEIEKAVEEGDSAQIFATGMLTKGHALAKNALADIQERHRDIVRLEKNIEELSQLFKDMAVLVESQGELLDVIEANVNKSAAYTAKGVSELHQARKYQISSHKKLCCIIVCLLIVIVVVLAPVLTKAVRSS
eukprot:tig00000140_g8477.t1